MRALQQLLAECDGVMIDRQSAAWLIKMVR
jgi:hypothetical protein